eukprot:jgi/Ulvmu1/1486/UM011_0216.1
MHALAYASLQVDALCTACRPCVNQLCTSVLVTNLDSSSLAMQALNGPPRVDKCELQHAKAGKKAERQHLLQAESREEPQEHPPPGHWLLRQHLHTACTAQRLNTPASCRRLWKPCCRTCPGCLRSRWRSSSHGTMLFMCASWPHCPAIRLRKAGHSVTPASEATRPPSVADRSAVCDVQELAAAAPAELQKIPGIGRVLSTRISEAARNATGAAPTLTTVIHADSSEAQVHREASKDVQEGLADLQTKVEDGHTLLNELSAAYYEGAPKVSDERFDAFKEYFEGHAADLKHRGIDTAGLALSEVGAPPPPGTALAKAEHSAERGGRLLSLAAVHSAREVRVWWARCADTFLMEKGWTADRLYLAVEPKVDGLTLRASYRAGACVQVATRGDGFVGEDVTHNSSAIAGLPSVPCGVPDFDGAVPQTFTVRGEVYISRQDFEELNRERAAAGLEPFSNARNAAAGSLRLLDAQQAARRRLSFVAFELLPGDEWHATEMVWHAQGHTDRLQLLECMGFETLSQYTRRVPNIEDAIGAAEELLLARPRLPFQSDGVVIKVDDFTAQTVLGANNTDPKWAIAWKPEAEVALTTLRDVAVSVGRSGIIVPVALLEPVEIAGVTISRASLHNTHAAHALGLHIGDTVVIERRGDVIPYVAEVLPQQRPQGAVPWHPPERCPACDAPLTLRAADAKGAVAMLECSSDACAGRQERLLKHFAAICIKGIGKKLVEKLMDEQLCRRPSDFYMLQDAQAAMEKWKGFGPKKIENILAAVDASKRQPPHVLLSGLGIPSVGQHIAKLLLKFCNNSISELSEQTVDDLVQVKGISQIKAKRIAAWFGAAENVELAMEVARTWGLESKQSSPMEAACKSEGGDEAGETTSVCLAGVELMPGDSIVATGAVPGMTRAKIVAWAETHGVRLAANVSSSTKLLIQGNARGASRKRQKAEELQVPILESTDDLQQVADVIGQHQ